MSSRYLQLEVDRNYTADLDFEGEIIDIIVKTTEGEFKISKLDLKEKPKPVYISDDDMDELVEKITNTFNNF